MSEQSLQKIQIGPSVDLDPIIKSLQQDGAVILQSLFSSQQVNSFLEDTKEPLACVRQGTEYSDEKLRLFYGSKTKRLSDLTSVSPTFRKDFLDHDLIHRVCETIFVPQCGTYWLGGAEIVEVGPGEKDQPLHRDQDEWPIFKLIGPSAPEACLNFLVALSDFTEQNGATRIIPGSNKLDYSVACNGAGESIPAVMNAGDCLLLSGKTVHGAGANHTNYQRLGLVLAMQCSYLTPEEAFPLHVGSKTAETMSPRARSMVGLSSHFAKDGTGLWQGVNCTVRN
ncbi:hypothetical protein N7493_008219 [Penicillium malachiteum]|uniref:Uncharacterized protein n=1 Tax=Penicillium malachiteum TaxID=1324776 RepID=A0AAD6MTJ7_9EURO|nr:hypothetical protein N7493_008219 [Penicillium malachiteum]